MYSRKLGIADGGEESRKSLENFNKSLREQYSKKRNAVITERAAESTATQEKHVEESSTISSVIDTAKSFISNLDINIDFETLLIIGLILLILSDADTVDLVLLGILTSLIL